MSIVFHDGGNPRTHLLARRVSFVEESPYICAAAKMPVPRTGTMEGGINVNVPVITVRRNPCRIQIIVWRQVRRRWMVWWEHSRTRSRNRSAMKAHR